MKKIASAVLGLFFIGCAISSNAQISADALENSSWILVSISCENLNLEKMPALRFLEKRASGFNGVNSFSANYKLSNAQIIFSDMISTRMASLSPALSKLETDFTNALLQASSFELKNDILTIRGANNTLVFKRI
ncbi:MAG: META domain-containing protein [Campylobacteraceae bacterium]|nr:META domain-containing protein [Campylobacteraceae bacterium]